MTSEELNDWLKFYQEEPFGYPGLNLLSAMICATVANTTRTNKSDKVFSMQDFMLFGKGSMQKSEVKEETEEQLLMKVKLLNKIFNGKVAQ